MAKTFVRHAVEAHDREVRPQCHLRVDGVEALACLEGNLPDLVLLDVNMPRMDLLRSMPRNKIKSRGSESAGRYDVWQRWFL